MCVVFSHFFWAIFQSFWEFLIFVSKFLLFFQFLILQFLKCFSFLFAIFFVQILLINIKAYQVLCHLSYPQGTEGMRETGLIFSPNTDQDFRKSTFYSFS